MTSHSAPEYGIDLLLRKLEGVTTVGHNSYMALCPLHDDINPSLSINIGWLDSRAKLLIHCFNCGDVFLELLQHLKLEPWRVQTDLHFVDLRDPATQFGTVSKTAALGAEAEATVERFHRCLFDNPSQLSWICERRGLSSETVRYNQVGFDGHRFVLPIRYHRALANIKRYDADGGLPKWQGMRGCGAALFPDPREMHSEPWLVLVEGEWDALIAREHGLPAYSPTHGAMCRPRYEWLPYFKGKNVAICFDCDEAGRDGARQWAHWFDEHRIRCRIIDLKLSHKEDITDWFMRYGGTYATFLALVRSREWFRG